MLRSFLASLAFLFLTYPSLLFAADDLAILESVVAAGERVHPELKNYLTTIETARIEELMARLARDEDLDVAWGRTEDLVRRRIGARRSVSGLSRR